MTQTPGRGRERKHTMAQQKPQQRRAAGQKAAGTRTRNQTKSGGTATRSNARSTRSTARRIRSTARTGARQTQASAKQTVRNAEHTAVAAERTAETGLAYAVQRTKAAATQAERAVLIPVGATLIARDSVVETVEPYVKSAATRQREINKLVRRVSTDL